MLDPSKLVEQHEKNKIELYAEYGIGSFWGAVAAFMWLQLFAFVAFYIALAFVQAINITIIQMVIALGAFLFYFYQFLNAQSRILYTIKGYFSSHKGSYMPSGIKDALKAFFAVFFFSILILLLLGYTPVSNVSLLHYIPLYAVSLIASYVKKPKKFYQPVSLKNKIGFLLAGIFLLFMSFLNFGGIEFFTSEDVSPLKQIMFFEGAMTVLVALYILNIPIISTLFDE